MDGLTPASADDLPLLGELIVDDPFWAYPAGAARQGVAHLRVWATAGPEPGYLAVITETGGVASVTGSAGRIWAVLAGRFAPSLVLLEHDLAPESGEGIQTLDLVRAGPDGSPHWSRVWPTSQENPRHAGLEWWMAAHGYQIVSRPAGEFDWCEDEGGVLFSGLGMAGRGLGDPRSGLVLSSRQQMPPAPVSSISRCPGVRPPYSPVVSRPRSRLCRGVSGELLTPSSVRRVA